MRTINTNELIPQIEQLCIQANCNVDASLLAKLKKAKQLETSTLGKTILSTIIENDELAIKKQLPICQDTGIVVVFVEIGMGVQLIGNLEDAIHEGIRRGYEAGYLRKSVVAHPLNRINTKDNTPAIIHYTLVAGDQLKLTLAPKGAGSENVSQLAMLKPSDGYEGVKQFVLDTIKKAGGNPCPPIIVGVGIGGNFEYCATLAKKALLRELDDTSNDEICAQLETELLQDINALNIGPAGFGGQTTALAVKVNAFPCHIASLPVAVNIQCHVARHLSITI